jgi:hypothetical protein
VTSSIVILTEVALSPEDAARLVGLHADEKPAYRVLVSENAHRGLLAEVVDRLSLLELREAVDAVRHRDDFTPQDAAVALQESLEALRAAGAASAEGEVVSEDPISALEQAVAGSAADEVHVVTVPHAVEDTFHRDWGSKARERLGVPVLHVYAGSSWTN